MIIKLLLTGCLPVMVLAAACGGGEASTAEAPKVAVSGENYTVASSLPERTPAVQSTGAPSTAHVDEANRAGARTHFEAGIALQKTGRLEEAIAEYGEAIRLDPWLALAHMNRGLVHKSLGGYLRAMQDYDEAIQLDPVYALAYMNREVAYSDLASMHGP